MKIIKHGNKVSRRFACCECGCEFEAFDGEFVYHPASEYKGGKYTIKDYYESYCPECGERCFN